MERKKYMSLKLTVTSIVIALGLSNCTTTYDAYGRPVESVDPGAAAIGAVALGVAAYAIGKNSSRSKNHHYYGHRGHYGHHDHYGYRRPYRGCY